MAFFVYLERGVQNLDLEIQSYREIKIQGYKDINPTLKALSGAFLLSVDLGQITHLQPNSSNYHKY